MKKKTKKPVNLDMVAGGIDSKDTKVVVSNDNKLSLITSIDK